MTRDFHPIDILTLAEVFDRDRETALRIASASAMAALHALPGGRDEMEARKERETKRTGNERD